MQLSESEFSTHAENNDGFCSECKEFTRIGDTEPDAERYRCPICLQFTCVGAELALLSGLIEF